MTDGSQHHHVCSSDGRLVFPIQQLEVLVERIPHQIDEFHMTFINGVIYSPFIYFKFYFYSYQARKFCVNLYNKINLHIFVVFGGIGDGIDETF